nr:histone H1oo-like isoform X2 [Cavia porcellus]XP_004999688.1 histone H1oo-like isoform X2 [Cavia porcellus]XP_004999689.1 histone H1oo-like isoform X2 [Cavia porcellus]XP_023420794.1 histone H1oo-like isoform X2 [Cavia porcellus]XP_023420796.1 histone H1oo-like isoform X2 [Cavia porcellus]
MVTRCHPTVLRMVLEALQAGEQRRGTSVAAIKLYILHKYPKVDVTRFKYLLKQALATGMSRGLLARPINSKARGATGSFKLVPKHQKKPQCSRKSTRTGPAGSSKKKIAEPCEARASCTGQSPRDSPSGRLQGKRHWATAGCSQEGPPQSQLGLPQLSTSLAGSPRSQAAEQARRQEPLGKLQLQPPRLENVLPP